MADSSRLIELLLQLLGGRVDGDKTTEELKLLGDGYLRAAMILVGNGVSMKCR